MAKLVFCEDDPKIRKLIEVALRSSGHQLMFAANGAEGLQMIEKERPDAVFTDVAMPVLDGFELCRHIRANPDLQHLPIILVTASVQRSDLENGLRCGATDSLKKPFTLEELRSKVAQFTRPAGVT
jgi:CheY-like chemotaxis protein